MTRLSAVVFLACLLACGAARAQAPQADASPHPSIMLARVIMAFPAGTVWVDLKGSRTFCDEPGITKASSGGREAQELPPYAAAFKTEMERVGYRVVTPGETIFSILTPPQRISRRRPSLPMGM